MMSRLSISQNVYPSKFLIGKDTVCIISISQVEKINNLYVDMDECKELNDSLNASIINYNLLASNQKALISVKNNQIAIQDSIIMEKDNIISNDNKIVQEKNKVIKLLKLQRNGLALLSIIFVVISIL